MTALVPAATEKPGLLDNLSPTVVFFGSLGLIALAVVLLVISHKLRGGKSEARELIVFLGWALGFGGLFGIVYAIFPNILG